MDSSATLATTPQLFLPSSELELNEPLLSDLFGSPSPSHSFNPFAFDGLRSQEVYFSPQSDWGYPTPSSPDTTTSTHQSLPSSIARAEVTKRDWLSSLSLSSRPSHPAVQVSFSPSLQELADGPASSQHDPAGKPCAEGTGLADNGKAALSQSMHSALSGCASVGERIDGKHTVQEEKDIGPRPSTVALRLSDIIAALRPRPSSVSQHVSTSPSPSPNGLPATVSVCQTVVAASLINPASRSPLQLNTLPGILDNVDRISQETHKNAIPAVGLTRRDPKRSKKLSKSERRWNNKGLDDASSLKAFTLNGSKELRSVIDEATKREVHIFSERARRRGMMHLYGTLSSLLPEGKVKKVQLDRCAVLTETMKYIESLLEQLQELGKQRTDVLASIGSKAGIESSFTNAMDAEMGFSDSNTSVSMLRDSSFENIADHTNLDMKAVIAAAFSSYYSSLEDNSQGGSASMCENDEDDDDDGDCIIAEVGNVNDMAMYGGEGKCVRVRLFGDQVFITVWAMRKKGALSGLLELLQQLGFDVVNITVSAGLDTADHHSIHATIPSGCKLQSFQIRRCLKTFVNGVRNGSSMPPSREVTID